MKFKAQSQELGDRRQNSESRIQEKSNAD
jgi:hypothetical protein